MSRTADKSTPQIPEATGFPLPWDEALRRAGSFDKLQPRLHMGQILACHGGLYSWPDVRQRSEPGYFKPEWWAHAYVQAGRLMFFIEEVMFGPPVQEHVFAYTSSIKLDSVAFDTFFPGAGLPPAEHSRPLPTQAEPAIADPAPASAAPPANPGGRHDRDLVLEETKPVIVEIVDPASPAKGGRPTDRDLVLDEASWRLGVPSRTRAETLKAFAGELREWLEEHGEYRAGKTGEVMKAKTIEGHVRPLWNARKRV